ncbi:MAG: flavoprotein [Chloroflexota bacterium]
MFERIYLIVTGTLTAYRAPELISGLTTSRKPVITILTPNAGRVIAPRELARVPGHHLVESYFDDNLLPRPAPGLVLIAPCSFNTLNKLAAGVADNLALSITQEMIGQGEPVIVAPSVNPALWRHPLTARSIATLESWGVRVLAPNPADDYMMRPVVDILAEAEKRLK